MYAHVLEKPASSVWSQPPQAAAAHGRGESKSTLFDLSDEKSEPETLVPRENDYAASSDEDLGRESGSSQRHDIDTDFIHSWEQNDDLPGQIARISISHDGDYATAVCLAAEEVLPGDVGGEAAAREP